MQGQADVALCAASLFQTGYVLHPLWAAGCAGFAACSEMGRELFCSCGLLCNKTEAFRSSLDQHLDLLVSSVTACDLVSVICAVKVIISGGWMCYPTPVPAAYPAG